MIQSNHLLLISKNGGRLINNMDKEVTNVRIFNDAVANLTEVGADVTAQQTTYLSLIAHSMASIADSLNALTELRTTDPMKLMWEEFQNELEEERRK